MAGLFRNHPFLVATSAASGGVLLGAYAAFQIFAAPVTPAEQRGPAASAPQPVAQAKASDTAASDTKAPPIATAPAIAETTGSAPPAGDVAAADRCKGQTWPNLVRDCMEQMQSRKATRTVSSDRVGKSSPEATPAANAAPGTQPAGNQTAAAPPPAAQPAAAPTNPPDATSGKPAKTEKHKVKEAKRKTKRPKSEEGGDRAFAYAPNGDRDDAWGDQRAEDRWDRSRRERAIVRGENDDSDRASERRDRRAIVIGRERDSGGGFGGGIFENLFGN